ncbi:MAG: SGNH/GDSL hydrolase family protein [Cytophagales bacterium]|nr:SGNH/GDSL hydrolase family protein [Cytophagales bacterium]
MLIISVITILNTYGQLPFAIPATQDTSWFGGNIQRTMHLLSSSTASHRNTVKILVYGQSISEQAWSDTVKKDLQTRYPHANIIMINRAIGAFSSQLLKKPMYFDINTFYPDLILFHVYGSSFDLDSIMNNIRRSTTAEVLFQTAHVTDGDVATGSWENTYSYNRIPDIAKKDGLEFADIRTPWYKYLSDNGLTPTQCTSDGTHLNDRGNFLMARLLKRYLYRNTKYEADPLGLVTTYAIGTDVQWANDKITLPVNGNKIEIIADAPVANMDYATLSIDGISPSMHSGVVMFTRPTVPYNYAWKNGWPWNVAGPIRISNSAPLLEETWTLTITSMVASGSTTTLGFSVSGSLTGADGSGTVTYNSNTPSGSKFESNSKRVVINGDDWFTYPSISNPYRVGLVIRWEARRFATNTFFPPLTVNAALDSAVTVAQGIANGPHTLVIERQGNKNVPIKAIRVYRPYLYRKTDTDANVSVPMLTLVGGNVQVCSTAGANLTAMLRDINTSTGVINYYRLTDVPNAKHARVENPANITLAGTYKIAKSASNNTIYELTVVANAANCSAPHIVVTHPSITMCSHKTIDLTKYWKDIRNTQGISIYSYDNTFAQTIADPTMASVKNGIFYVQKTNTFTGISATSVLTMTGVQCIPLLTTTSNMVTMNSCVGVNLRSMVWDVNSLPGALYFFKDSIDYEAVTTPENVNYTSDFLIQKTSDSGYVSKVVINVNINCNTPTVAGIGENNHKMRIYPNPVTEIINIVYNDDVSHKYSICDMQGIVLQEGTIPESGVVEVSAIKSGIYILEVKWDFDVKKYKIIKN